MFCSQQESVNALSINMEFHQQFTHQSAIAHQQSTSHQLWMDNSENDCFVVVVVEL